MRYSLVILCFLAVFSALGQGDSVKYSKDFLLNEGLYLSYQDFRNNWPIPKEKISTNLNKEQLDLYTKLLEEESIGFIERDGTPATVLSKNVWGYCQNNFIYINFRKGFYRLPTFGAISFFIAMIEINSYSPGYNMMINNGMYDPNMRGTAKEYREFLLDFYTGQLYEYSPDKLLEMFKSDPAIYNEYAALSKKKKKESATRYIRMYNDKHPVYFPNGK